LYKTRSAAAATVGWFRFEPTGEIMHAHTAAATAAKTTSTVIGNISVDQLEARTPCSEFTVRQLINHLLFWGPSLAGAAHKETVPPAGTSEEDVDLTDDWPVKLAAQTDALAAGWSEPRAWQGETTMGGPTAMPADMVGAMVVGELVVHTWDLARATGQQPVWDDDLLSFLLPELAATAEQGRQMGIFGPAVAVPDTSPLLDRILGLTGRDPHWTV
jgi:uncharacterized protein (TIGR03086 family)